MGVQKNLKPLLNKEENEKDNTYSLSTKTKSCDILNIISVCIAIIAIGIIVGIGYDECKKCFNSQNQQNFPLTKTKTFWAHGKNIESGYLKHVFLVLDRLGFKNEPNATDWDLLWSHDYPFRTLFSQLNNLKPHQRVNHFPGCGYLTNKVDLATSGLKYIPPAFKLPVDKQKLLDFTQQYPNKSFVIKNNDHRNVRVKQLNEVDLDAEGSFVQVFIDNPLLISGHMFDIGIYTIITSIDPLRIYIYNGDVLLRFCPDKYKPFDPKILDKYVVGDDYLPTWDVPGLEYYYKELGFGMRESLSAYLQSKGKNANTIWEQIDDAIRTVVLAKEPLILDIVNRFKSKRNFFEMMRFDFVVDEDLNVLLMEANMSPNLSSAHYKPNQLLYEQVIFNLFGLLGIGERVKKDSLATRSIGEELMQTADKNIAVMAAECNSAVCRDSCMPNKCQLCRPCLTPEMKANLLQAHREHINRGDCKRIFPPPMVRGNIKLPDEFEKYSIENQLMYKWFQEKCIIDSTWCN